MNCRFAPVVFTLAVLLRMAVPGLANECPSQLPNALKPFSSNSPLEWAAELTLRTGQTRGEDYTRSFNNEMVLLGLGYRPADEWFAYVEGGVKYWDRSGIDGTGKAPRNHEPVAEDDSWTETRHAGLREAYVEHTPGSQVLRLGLQSMTAGDLLLLDERVLAGYAATQWGALKLQGGAGTVSTEFSRMGKFCGTRHNYRPLEDYYRDDVADALGESNFGFLTAAWRPDSGDAFEAANADVSALALREVGVTVLSEFGSAFSNNATFLAAFARTDLPLGLGLGTEAVIQFDEGRTAQAYLADLDKTLDAGAAGLLRLHGGYLAAPDNNDTVRFAPTFANLFLGELLKLDAPHAPLYYAEVVHTVPLRWPVHAGILYAAQAQDDRARELDLEVGVQPREGIRLFGVPLLENASLRLIYSVVDADDLPEQVRAWKVELRWAL